jgi:hypothetical protein
MPSSDEDVENLELKLKNTLLLGHARWLSHFGKQPMDLL